MNAENPQMAARVPPAICTAVVLAGGKGTRLLPLTGDRLAKPAVMVRGRPFVDYIIEQLHSQGVTRIILSLGHKAETVVSSLRRYGTQGATWDFFVEDRPLGTAGPLALLGDQLPENFFVLNGDTLVVGLDYAKLAESHLSCGAQVSVAIAKVDDAQDYGTVATDGSGRVVRFYEKGTIGAKTVNSGVYVFHKSVLGHIPAGRPFSIERELLPLLLREGARVHGYEFEGRFFDIGTPKRLADFERFVAKVSPGGC